MSYDNSTPETIADICREIREYCDGRRQPYDTVVQTCANHIERMYEREIEERDRLAECLRESIECVCAGCPRNPCESSCEVVAKWRAALAKAAGEEAAL